MRQMRDNIENAKLVLYIPYEWWGSECSALLLKQIVDESDFSLMLKTGSESFQSFQPGSSGR
jgi:hypothetical protein